MFSSNMLCLEISIMASNMSRHDATTGRAAGRLQICNKTG
jgi:hypothetical protein